MDLRRWVYDMRTRTALVLFLTSLVLGGILTFALGAFAAEPEATPSPKVIEVKGGVTNEKQPVTGSGFHWRDMAKGLDEAKSGRKPIVVDVYTDWCGWCKRMERDTYTSRDVQSYLEQTFVPVKLNAESATRLQYRGSSVSYRQLANGFRVTGYPTTVFLDADGGHIVSAPGYMRANDFLTVLRFIGDGHYKKKSFEEYKGELGEDSDSGAGR
jgi:thioredoxin-related protein